MRGPTAVSALVAACLLAGCGATVGSQPAPVGASTAGVPVPTPALGPPDAIVHVGAHLMSTPPPPSPLVPPALPVGTVAAAPGHPMPLPAGAVALTFDDGPDPRWTPQVLAVLARYHAQATFFVIGVHAEAYPSIVRAEYDQGHGVGNHTWTHADLTTLPPAQQAEQIVRTASIIATETGHQPTCLRPPYDAIAPSVEETAAEQHEALMLYDVDPRDWQRPGVATIVARVLAGARPGAVVDLHDAGGDRAQTLAALPGILQGLAARKLVTVPICRA